jgi:hypothetical protein
MTAGATIPSAPSVCQPRSSAASVPRRSPGVVQAHGRWLPGRPRGQRDLSASVLLRAPPPAAIRPRTWRRFALRWLDRGLRLAAARLRALARSHRPTVKPRTADEPGQKPGAREPAQPRLDQAPGLIARDQTSSKPNASQARPEQDRISATTGSVRRSAGIESRSVKAHGGETAGGGPDVHDRDGCHRACRSGSRTARDAEGRRWAWQLRPRKNGRFENPHGKQSTPHTD